MTFTARSAAALAATALAAVSAIAAAAPASAATAAETASGHRHGMADRAIQDLDAQDRYPDTAFGETAPDQVVLEISDHVDPGELIELSRFAAEDEAETGARITVTRFSGDLVPAFAGGDAIYGPSSRCSAGFNVFMRTGEAGFLTAGHCGNHSWATSSLNAFFGITVATTSESSFNDPSRGYPDYAVARYTDAVAAPASVNLYNGTQQPIYAAGSAQVGESVEKSGSTTSLSAGMVTALNVTVNYRDGSRVEGMIATDMCTQGGDSGGVLFDKGIALGLTSGGTTECAAPRSYYQPIQPALRAFGATLKVSD